MKNASRYKNSGGGSTNIAQKSDTYKSNSNPNISTTISPSDKIEIMSQGGGGLSLIPPHELFTHLDVLPQTKNTYIQKVRVFIKFLSSHGLHASSFRDFKSFLHANNTWTTSTKNVYLTAARVYCQQLHAQGYIPVDITKTTKGFSQSRKHKKFGINEEEVTQLMEYIHSLPTQHTCDKKAARLKAIFALLLFQGLRQIEIVRIQRDDVDLANSVIYIQGKGKTDKEKIYLHPHAQVCIDEYIKICDIRSGPLFFSFSGRRSDTGLTTRSLRRIVTNVLQSLDIDKSTHGFRHYFTTTLLKAFGGDILKTKAFTRHASTEMLVVYNDEINHEKNLPDFYDAFNQIDLDATPPTSTSI